MINYYLELSMADKKLPITERMRNELCECCKQASNTVVARREKRTYSIIGRKDEYTLYMTLTSRNEVLPNRSLSTLTRRVTANEYMKKLLVGHTPNGSVFRSTLLEEDEEIMDPEDYLIWFSDLPCWKKTLFPRKSPINRIQKLLVRSLQSSSKKQCLKKRMHWQMLLQKTSAALY